MTTIPDSSSTHQDDAQTIRLDLQRISQGIRGFALLTSERRRKLTLTGNVEDEFLRRMSLLLDAHPAIANSSEVTGTEIRDHLNFHSAYEGVGEELVLHGRKMNDTLRAERADIGRRALCALKMARDKAGTADIQAVVPQLDAIDREFARGRRRRVVAKKPDEAEPPKTPKPPETSKPPEVKS
jgi:hypothetical protein